MKYVLEQEAADRRFIYKHFSLQPNDTAAQITISWIAAPGKWGSYQLVDPNGEVRAHYIGGRTPQPVILGRERWHSPYTVSGPFPKGVWTLKAGAISTGTDCSPGVWGTIEVSFADSESQDGLAEGSEQLWFDRDKPAFALTDYPWAALCNPAAGWYKGDLHTHTIFSDGKMTREENIAMAKRNGLDFFVATDHNIVPTSWPASDVLVIPGTEITTPIGHYNQLGTRRDPFLGADDVSAVFSEAGLIHLQQLGRELGTLNSINHPFLGEWKWLVARTDLSLIDSIEIWNDPTYKENEQAAEQALRAWDIITQDGRHITGVGGSDSHMRPEETYPDSSEPSVIGDPGTYVYARCLSADELLGQIRKGRVFVSRYGCMIDFKVNGQLPGSVLAFEKGSSYQATLHTVCDRPLVAEWIVDGRLYGKSVAVGVEKTLSFADGSYHWVRITIRDQSGRLIGFTNPVYFGDKQPTLLTWKDVLEQMDD